MRLLTLLFCLVVTEALAQDRATHIVLGTPLGMAGNGSGLLQPKPGFLIGLNFWFLNEKGNAWSLGATYHFFSRKYEDQKETFEYLTLRGMPIVYQLDKKKKWYFEIGLFANYLLHQELQDKGSVINSTKLIQRSYVGPSAGFGVRLGEEGKSRILFGARNDFGVLGFGKGTPLKFNTLSLFAGLEI